MGAHEELVLITKIIDTGYLAPVLKKGIGPDHFKNKNTLALFRRIIHDWRKWDKDGDETATIPTREIVARDFPTIQLPKADRRSLEVIVDDFLNFHLVQELSKMADFIISWKDSPADVLGQLGPKIRELNKVHRTAKDIVLSKSIKTAADRYESSRDRDGIKGIPYPWEVLNHATQGMLPGEFILFYGRPKSLKTWVLLRLATYAYDFANRRVLIYTREMTPEQMMDRCICLLIGAPYTALKEGKLSEIPAPYGGNMEEMFYDLLSSIQADEKTCALEYGYNKSLIITSDRDDTKGGGVQGLREKIKHHKPDLVCADALYLMRNDRDGGRRSVKWNDQAAITQDLKDLALDQGVPLIGTTQANRGSEEKKGQNVSNISFSDSYGMDCDLAIEIIKRKLTDETNELALAITGAREINLSGFAIHGNPATSFDILYEKYRDSAGVEQLDEDGNPLEVPVIFNDFKDIKNFLKKGEADEKPKVSKTRAQYARLAQAAFKDARKHP